MTEEQFAQKHQGLRRRHLDHAREVQGAIRMARGGPAAGPDAGLHHPARRRANDLGFGQGGGRGHGRAAGAKDHAADARQGPERHGQALRRSRGAAAQVRRLQDHGRPGEGSRRRQVRGPEVHQAQQHPRADAIDAAQRQGRRYAAARHRGAAASRSTPSAVGARSRSTRRSARRPRESWRRRNSRSWPSAISATSGRMRTSSIDERRHDRLASRRSTRWCSRGVGADRRDDGRSGGHRPRYRAHELARAVAPGAAGLRALRRSGGPAERERVRLARACRSRPSPA